MSKSGWVGVAREDRLRGHDPCSFFTLPGTAGIFSEIDNPSSNGVLSGQCKTPFDITSMFRLGPGVAPNMGIAVATTAVC